MDSSGWLLAAAILAVALAGVHAVGTPDQAADDPDVTVETCESLPDYDYERTVARVEEIKGMELRRNLSICTEGSAGGIDTTPNQGRFARVEEPGLALFGLDAATNSDQRSSLGHTTFSPSGGPVETFLANETVVENVSWISYEALVAHELSHAIDNSHLRPDASDSGDAVAVRRTTDWTLANRALSEGSTTYVSDRYVREYGGELNVSELGDDSRSWKHRFLVATYAAGYDYARTADVTSAGDRRVNATARILHPERATDPGTFPARANLSMDSLERVRTDRVGELFVREALISRGTDPERAAAAADGWTNDRMDYYRANGSTVVSWRVEWRNASERAEFVETYDAAYDYERMESIRSVSCAEPGRYLGTSEKSVTVLQCGD